MTAITILSYLAVYFLGIATVFFFLGIAIWRFERKRTAAQNEAASRLKEHLDARQAQSGPILVNKD